MQFKKSLRQKIIFSFEENGENDFSQFIESFQSVCLLFWT